MSSVRLHEKSGNKSFAFHSSLSTPGDFKVESTQGEKDIHIWFELLRGALKVPQMSWRQENILVYRSEGNEALRSCLGEAVMRPEQSGGGVCEPRGKGRSGPRNSFVS